jgi:transcriptional regulator NrdR family protein
MNHQMGDDNPFSFKKFLNSKVNKLGDESIKILVDEQPKKLYNVETNSKQTEEPNPFSFRQFLNETSHSAEQIKFGSLISDQDRYLDKESESTLDRDDTSLINVLLPPLANLPDFVSESIQIDGNLVDSITKSNHINENPYDVLENIPYVSISDNERSYFDLEPKISPLNLPNIEIIEEKSQILNDTIDRILPLTKTNEQIISEQQEHIQKLEKRIKKLTTKEELENKTLEAMVQQIEKNLETTTIRAIEAEKLVDKLKYENKAIKEKNQSLQVENELLKKEILELRVNRSEQSLSQFSSTLRNAATSAEETIKTFNASILNGVYTLKQLADNLDSFNKISEIPNDNTKK